jgi:hypothetical protein
VGSFQKQIFKTLTDNFQGLTDVTVALADVFGDILDAAGVSRADIAAMQGDYTATGERVGGGGAPIYEDAEGKQFKFLAHQGKLVPMEFGGPISPSSLAMVGEAGRELLKTGNQGGEVINNTTTEKIMGAANAVVNNMGNDASDVLKQISDILNQSNTIQSNILKETRRSKGFQY